MGKYVRIQSTKTITVTKGLFANDVTNPQSLVPDKFNVQECWTGLTCKITAGNGYYPAEIATWNTVKSLENAGVLVVSAPTDTCDNADEVDAKAKQLETEQARVDAIIKKPRKSSKQPVEEKVEE